MIALAFTALAATGTLARWQLSRFNTLTWPHATLAINVAATFLLGLIADTSTSTMTLAGVGFLGSFSTFSTVVREVVDLSNSNGRAWAAKYVAATLVLGVAAALVGLELASTP